MMEIIIDTIFFGEWITFEKRARVYTQSITKCERYTKTVEKLLDVGMVGEDEFNSLSNPRCLYREKLCEASRELAYPEPMVLRLLGTLDTNVCRDLVTTNKEAK